jgi:hypothetical protein
MLCSRGMTLLLLGHRPILLKPPRVYPAFWCFLLDRVAFFVDGALASCLRSVGAFRSGRPASSDFPSRHHVGSTPGFSTPTFIFTGTIVARKALRPEAHRFAASGLDPRRHPGVLASMSSTPRPAASTTNEQTTAQRRTMQDQSRRRPSQVFSMELVQQLLEGFLSCPAGHRHGLKIDRRLLYRALSSGTINLPLPRFRER